MLGNRLRMMNDKTHVNNKYMIREWILCRIYIDKIARTTLLWFQFIFLNLCILARIFYCIIDRLRVLATVARPYK